MLFAREYWNERKEKKNIGLVEDKLEARAVFISCCISFRVREDILS